MYDINFQCMPTIYYGTVHQGETKNTNESVS
jgi:hypothetical protein